MSEEKIIKGSEIAKEIKKIVKSEIELLKKERNRAPGLVTILVGDDPGSKVYVDLKQKACEEVGIYSEKLKLESNVSEEKLIQVIQDYNTNKKIDGILVQLPLPKHLNSQKIMAKINPEKDVDGFHPLNTGLIANGDEDKAFIPCTPKAMIYLLEKFDKLKGKNIVIINHSPLIGRPLSMLLLNRNATVTIVHEYTEKMKEHLKIADIIVTAVGKPNLVSKDMVKKGVIILDAGFSRIEGKIKGDVDFENMLEKVSKITPPTGGIGPMTIAMLLDNTLKAYNMRNK